MTTEALKSASITDADASPVVRESAGIGGRGVQMQKGDYITTTSGKTVGSTYRLVRIKSTDVVKGLWLETAAMGGSSAADFGLYYSDTADGTSPANVAASATPISAAFFASAVSLVSALGKTDILNESGTYTVDKRNKPIWEAAGLSSDPGGFFDIVATTTATITTGALMGISVEFISAG
jgi:hypothetical protein